MFGGAAALTAREVREPGGVHVFKVSVLEFGILIDKFAPDFFARPFFRMVDLRDDLLDLADQFRRGTLRPLDFLLDDRSINNVKMIMINIPTELLR